MSLSVNPNAFNSALCGALSTPCFISSLLMFCASWLWFILFGGIKELCSLVLGKFYSPPYLKELCIVGFGWCGLWSRKFYMLVHCFVLVCV